MKKRNFGHFKEVTAQKNKCANKAAVQALGNNWVHSLGSGEGSGEGLAGLRGGESQFRVLGGVWAMLCGLWDLSSMTRGQTHASCFGSLESQQLDWRGSPE